MPSQALQVYPGLAGNEDQLERSRSSFEQMVQASLQSIMDGQRAMKQNFDHFKSDIIKAVEFQNEEIKELYRLPQGP